ncbi:hypothetical protein [Tenacibaculum discolor]|uniref:hypothetical protein n=1 Tax=Tenacibaculum discolor TaxID=361581 RepID=UPI000F594C4A|nr:hypothetical protein [Tenacibaculum discolor]
MKTNFKNFAYIVLFSVFALSCESNDVNEIEKEIIDNPHDPQGGLLCSKINDEEEEEPIEIGKTKTYTVDADYSTYQWSIVSGENIEVIGATDEKSFTVKFNEGFTEAKINVVFSNCNLTFGVEK